MTDSYTEGQWAYPYVPVLMGASCTDGQCHRLFIIAGYNGIITLQCLIVLMSASIGPSFLSVLLKETIAFLCPNVKGYARYQDGHIIVSWCSCVFGVEMGIVLASLCW